VKRSVVFLIACAGSHPEPRAGADVDRCAAFHLEYAPGQPDADLDCIPDKHDRCVNAPEDHDDHETDGCPDPDNDGDGVLDAKDKCPDDRGEARFDGCQGS
jgi:hypothetical protein